MDYKRIYDQLIKKRVKQPSTQNYTQVHHIIPRSIKPELSRCKANLVKLSAREHFIAHALLVKITQKDEDKSKYYKMVYAFNSMNRNANNSRYINSHLYQLMKYRYNKVRKQLCEQFKPTKGKIWITNLELRESKLVYKNQQLEQGWLKGRIKDYNNFDDALNEQNHHHFINYQEDIKNGIVPRMLYNKKNYITKKQKQLYKQEKIKLAKQYFNYYKHYGFQKFVAKFNYTSSQAALCQFLKLYIPDQFIQLKNHKITVF